MTLLLLWLTFFLGCLLAGFLLQGTGTLSLGVVVALWVVVGALLLPMLAVLRHNYLVRRQQRRAAGRKREAVDRFEREHPVRLDRFPPALVASIRALLLKELGAFPPGNERQEDRTIETLCMMLVERARSVDIDDEVYFAMKYKGSQPDAKIVKSVTRELYRIKRENEIA